MVIKKLFVYSILMCITVVLQAQKVEVNIVQDGKVIEATNDVFRLNPKTFSFQIRATGVEGFLIGVTADEDIYRSALGDADLEVMWFDETGMAESFFNGDKEVFVNDEAPSYWYFSSTKDHRFDLGANGNADSWQAFRTVKSFYFMNTEKTVSVSKMTKPLYFFFYLPVYDESYNLLDKTSVFKAQLVWE